MLSCVRALLWPLLLMFSSTPIYTSTGDKKYKKSTKPSKTGPQEQGIALCYARKSVTQGDDDQISIERQKENMLARAMAMGLKYELYVDADGHKSGREEQNRPEWLKLKSRIGQPGVRALILNDLSRAHRRGWRVGQLLDMLNRAGVQLILTAPGREIDFNSPTGKLFVAIVGMVDEWYAEDIAMRQLDRYANMRKHGRNGGPVPFGTIRQPDGFLQPSPFGAWLLSEGRWSPGRIGDEPPEPGAIWRGYYSCVRRILDMYSRNNIGTDGITHELQTHGWAFRNRRGTPLMFDRDDVRRIIASWPKLAGLVVIGRLKDRQIGDIALDWPDSGRNLFPLPLLRRVAWVERDRRKQRAPGSVNNAHAYPMRGIAWCAHCALKKEEQGESTRPVRLTGTDKGDRRSYIHAAGVRCTCRVRSVREEVMDTDVRRWLSSFALDTDTVQLMQGLTSEIEAFEVEQYEELEAARRASIASCRRRLKALDARFTNGTLKNPDTYPTDRAALVAEQRRLHQQVIPREAARLDMSAYVRQVTRPVHLWDSASVEDRQVLMALLVDHLYYDLDQQGTPNAITGYVLQPWAEWLLKRE